MHTIFQKDARLLFRQMIAALGVQAFIMVFIPILSNMISMALNNPNRFPVLENWFPMVQISITGLIALIAAALWDVEERMGKNDLFLRRLPVSMLRIRLEKTAAGLFILLITILIQWLWFAMVIRNGMPTFCFSVTFIGVYAYLVGLPLSKMFKQTITVILIGSALVLLGFLLLNIYLAASVKHREEILQLTSIAGLIIAFVLTALVILLSHQRRMEQPKSRYALLVGTHRRENRIFIILSLVLFFVIILSALSNQYLHKDLLFLDAIAGVLLILAIGVSTYNQDEKHGLQNMLYHQPLNLNELFWTRWLNGFLYCLFPAFCIMFILMVGHKSYVYSLFQMNPIQVINNTIAWGYPLRIDRMGAFPPGHGIGLLLTFFCVAYLPYICGLLFTHAIRNYVYAFLETILALLVVAGFCSWMLLSNTHILGMVLYLQYFSMETKAFLPPIPWVLIALIVGLTLAAWRTATDRDLLTRDTLYRQLYVGRLFLCTMAVIAILFKTGWGDLFFLITGVRFPIG